MTCQRTRLVESITGRKNRLQALVRGYLPGLMEVLGKPWESASRTVMTVVLNPFVLLHQNQTVLREALQEKVLHDALPHGLVSRLLAVCAHLAHLYQPAIDAGLLTETFFDDLRDEMVRELRLIDMEKHELEELEAAIARRYREVAPEDHLGTLKGIGTVTAPTLLAAIGTPQRFRSQASFCGWTGIVPHARQSAESDAKGLTMTKAGPRRVKLDLYQAAEVARRWDPQLAKIYYDQMVHKGKPHYKAMGAVMSHLASRVHAVLVEQRDYILRDVDGRAVSAQEARMIIQTRYRVPAEIRAERRTNRRRKSDVSTRDYRGSARRSSRRSSASSKLHSARPHLPDQPEVLTFPH